MAPSKSIRYLLCVYVAASLLYALFHVLQPYGVWRFASNNMALSAGSKITPRSEDSSLLQHPIRVLTNPSTNDNALAFEDLLISKAFSGAMSDKVQPYFYKAHATFDPEDITVTTLVTHNRFQVLSRLASHYKGPISVAVHVTDTDQVAKQQVLKDLDDTVLSNPDMQQYVNVHLITDAHDRQFNMWRNVAKLFAPTEYIMMLDVDFMICTDARQSLNRYPELKNLVRQGKAAVVIPAFEYVNPSDGEDWQAFPTTKKELIQKQQSNSNNNKKTTIDMFHRTWAKGHGATNYTRWYQAKAPYKVTTYDYSYEPYVIMKKTGMPWCDERFVGYGANKAACLYEIYLSGVDYWVFPNDFLIHQTHHYPEETRDRERKYNRKLYTYYREEACMRYGRIMKASGSWSSEQAANLKRECGKVRGFMGAMKRIES